MPDKPRAFKNTRQRPAKRQGGSATLRDHSRAYQRLRAFVLAENPLCQHCFKSGRITAATICDHRIALAMGGSNDRGNLQSLCRCCNDAKAVDEMRFIARGYDPADIMLDPDMRKWFLL